VESARQSTEGLGVGVSVGVTSGVLERLADENMTEDEEDTMEEELGIGSSELDELRVDDVVIESTADADTLEDWLTDALDGSKKDCIGVDEATLELGGGVAQRSGPLGPDRATIVISSTSNIALDERAPALFSTVNSSVCESPNTV
jgi:hypothetical protein